MRERYNAPAAARGAVPVGVTCDVDRTGRKDQGRLRRVSGAVRPGAGGPGRDPHLGGELVRGLAERGSSDRGAGALSRRPSRIRHDVGATRRGATPPGGADPSRGRDDADDARHGPVLVVSSPGRRAGLSRGVEGSAVGRLQVASAADQPDPRLDRMAGHPRGSAELAVRRIRRPRLDRAGRVGHPNPPPQAPVDRSGAAIHPPARTDRGGVTRGDLRFRARRRGGPLLPPRFDV